MPPYPNGVPMFTGDILRDYTNFWSNTPQGTTMPWAGGTLSVGPNQTGTYTAAGMAPVSLGLNTPLTQLWDIPGIRQEWTRAYGPDVNKQFVRQSFDGGSSYPYPEMQSPQPPQRPVYDPGVDPIGNAAENNSQPVAGRPTNFPDFADVEGPWSYSGLGPQAESFSNNILGQIGSLLEPENYLERLGLNLERARGMVSGDYREAEKSLPLLFDSAMRPAMQGALNKMAQRGMINSSTGQGIMGDTLSQVSDLIFGRQAGLEAERARELAGLIRSDYGQRVSMPSTLAQIAGLFGRRSESRDPSVGFRSLVSLLPTLLEAGRPTTAEDLV